MPEPDLDVKPASDSSSEGLGSETLSNATEQGDSKIGESFNEFLTKTVDEFKKTEGADESQPATEDGAEAKKSDSENEPDKAKKPEDKTEEEKAEGVDDGKEKVVEEEKGPIPYERFQELVSERDNIKREYESAQPKITNYDNIVKHCAQHNITPEQFHEVMNVQALLNTDPAKALEKLLPIVEQLQQFTGMKVPADLQKEVDDGTISLERAKEIASLRAKSTFGEKKNLFDRQAQERVQWESYQKEVKNSMATWESTKRGSDPDYKPKAKEGDLDGKWELTRDKFLAMLNQVDERGQPVYPVRTAQEGVELMERAYKQVSEFFTKRFNGSKTVTKKVISSNGSPGNVGKKTIEQADSLAEVIEMTMEKAGR